MNRKAGPQKMKKCVFYLIHSHQNTNGQFWPLAVHCMTRREKKSRGKMSSIDPKEMVDIFRKIAVLGVPPSPEPLWGNLAHQAQGDFLSAFSRLTEYSLPHTPRPNKGLMVQWLMMQQGYNTIGIRGLTDTLDIAMQGQKSKAHLFTRVWLPAREKVPPMVVEAFLEDLQSAGLNLGVFFAFSRFEPKPAKVRAAALRVDWLDAPTIYTIIRKHQPPAHPHQAPPPVMVHEFAPAAPVILSERAEPQLLRTMPEPQPVPNIPATVAPSAAEVQLEALKKIWFDLSHKDREELIAIAKIKMG